MTKFYTNTRLFGTLFTYTFINTHFFFIVDLLSTAPSCCCCRSFVGVQTFIVAVVDRLSAYRLSLLLLSIVCRRTDFSLLLSTTVDFRSCCRNWFVDRPRQFCCDSTYTTESFITKKIQWRCWLGL